jgi:hypothetical protein
VRTIQRGELLYGFLCPDVFVGCNWGGADHFLVVFFCDVSLHCLTRKISMDPTLEQWKQISEVIKEHKLLPFFDNAYQGFASGEAEKDAASVRMFVDDGHHLAMVQSFSKNFGLYGQRIGALSVVGATEEEAKRVVSQMKMVIRPMYSNPPRHGARLVRTILEDEKLLHDFYDQCRGMADRINSMRTALRTSLESSGSKKPWDHITKQIGMFAFSGLTKEEVVALRERHHVYCTGDGRISMAVSFTITSLYCLELVWISLTAPLVIYIFSGCYTTQRELYCGRNSRRDEVDYDNMGWANEF